MWLFSFAIQGIFRKKVCRGMNVPENSVSPFATQEILRKMVCRCREVHENIVFSFAIQVILQTKVCRGECKARKGRERKDSGSGWDGRAVECRMETASGLWHGSGAAEKMGPGLWHGSGGS